MEQKVRAFGIVPAAGRSRRMFATMSAEAPERGLESKLLLPWAGKSLIEQVVAQWVGSRVQRVFVVVHPEDWKLCQRLGRLPVELVCPTPSPREMKESVLAALERIRRDHHPRERDVCLVAPADLPQLTSHQIDAVLAAYDPADPALIVPQGPGGRGHPLLVPWGWAEELADLDQQQGLNALLDRHPVRCLPVADDQGRHDIDTWQEYRQQRERGLDGPA